MGEGEFTIKTEIFEGPLELLLELIERRKLLINDISLSKVADDFIGYVETMESMPMDETAQFILIASTLLLIKSKSLLPTLTLSEEEEQSIDELEKRLELYQRFKELSLGLKERFGQNVLYGREYKGEDLVVFSPGKDISTQSLLLAAQSVINSLPKDDRLPKAVVKKIVSLEEMIEKLTERVEKNIKLSFREFAPGGKAGPISREEKQNIIVSFLAVLELIKRGLVRANQIDTGDIEIETESVGVPTY